MLYFDIDTQTVHEKQGDFQDESFTSTLDIDEGFIIGIIYTTYDSFKEDKELHYMILDLYPSFEMADEIAKNLALFLRERDENYNKIPEKERKEIRKKILCANGTEYPYIGLGWGYSIKEIFSRKVKVQKEVIYKKY